MVASDNMVEHLRHLEQVFSIIKQARIAISMKKAEIGKQYINFLRLKIGNDSIKLQPHVVKKH